MSDTFEVRLRREAGYRFQVDFAQAGVPPLQVDETPPLGAGEGPNPARLLAAAVGDCLGASLLFCLGKQRVEVAGLDVEVVGTYTRNERNRLRIGGLAVTLELDARGAPEADRTKVEKCLGMFEDFCVVTASVRAGIDVTVKVVDPEGNVLHTT